MTFLFAFDELQKKGNKGVEFSTQYVKMLPTIFGANGETIYESVLMGKS